MKRTITLARNLQPGQQLRDHGGYGERRTVVAVDVAEVSAVGEIVVATSGGVEMHLPANLKVEVYG